MNVHLETGFGAVRLSHLLDIPVATVGYVLYGGRS